jgi:hypothetical protein
MIRDKKYFSSLIPLSHKEYVTFGDDKKGKVLGTGIIKVNDFVIKVLSNALYTTSVRSSLTSRQGTWKCISYFMQFSSHPGSCAIIFKLTRFRW